MKNISLALIITLITSINIFAQDQKVFEIKYAVTLEGNTGEIDKNNPLITVLNNESYTSITVNSNEGKYSYISAKEDETEYTLLQHDSKEYLNLTYSLEALEALNIDLDISSNQTQKIAGYTCNLAIVTIPAQDDESSETKIEVWYSKEIPGYDFNDLLYLSVIPGAALKIKMDEYNFEAFEVSRKAYPLSTFQIPDDYSEMEIDEAVDYNSLGDDRVYYEDETGEYFGLKDSEGNVITPAIYSSLSHFNEGVAIVTNSEGKYGAIDINGKEVMPFKYEYLFYEANENQYLFIENEKYGLIQGGKIIIPAQYESLSFLKDGFAIFGKGEKYGLIDSNNKVIVPAKFDHITDYSDELFVVAKDEIYSLYRIKDAKLITTDYDYISLITDSALFSVNKNGKEGFINKEGKVIIPIKYVYATPFVDGKAYVAENENMEDLHQIDVKGNRVD